jgi:hypothetical protein
MYAWASTIHGAINAEDLVRVPDTRWVITSGMQGPTVPQAHLYESVEVFRIDVAGDDLALTWIGAIELPHGCWGNDVACLPDGGLLVTSTTDISEGLEVGFGKSLSGEPTGKVVEWTPGSGWADLPGSVMNSTNGVAVSPDGAWVFIGGWVPMNVVRVSRGVEPPQIDVIPTGILTDNVTWSADGRLLAAGALDTTVPEFAAGFYGTDARCTFPTRIVKIDPQTLAVEVIADHDGSQFGVATTAIDVGDELWVGSMRWSGVARFTAG